MKNGNAQTRMSNQKHAVRKRNERARMRDMSFIPTQHWVHEDDLERVRKYCAKLKEKRLPEEEE
jgi:hypothetical protein